MSTIKFLVNNTGADLRVWEPFIMASLELSQAIPLELEALLVVRSVIVDGETRAVIDWA